MNEQNFKNHTRLVAGYHGATFLLLLAYLVGCLITFFQAEEKMIRQMAIVMLIGGFVLVGLVWYARAFALKAQDRAIRAEENFRHYILSGKPIDKNLRLSQIIALRFASDDEFLALAQRAVAEKLSAKDIKMAIKNWRGDYHRV
ncbi:MAG TPA: DUF6526 family protein [Chitinophagaceae bacterium]|jgi:high-affinity Fe2+/Pb2+ permease|nr:DUF6526 family protein [Chitinophagaceae bacterium]HNC40119.1 DUF6526 family protein [Chitinophagaceae bacterium]HND94999.1 DUF6526 family protein [Chitinophagaceae bacterium]HNF45967.1 DUF6526 family protein [Chitinophagaceae bacterium]HNJ25237.1 DUF6526 family protein [Chitinophagaceae bacterium]